MQKRLTWKRSLDGCTDVGLREGVTVGEAICKLADLEESNAGHVEQGLWEPHPYHPGLVRCSKCKERIIREDAAEEEPFCAKCGTRLTGMDAIKNKLIELLEGCVDENVENDDPHVGFEVEYGNIADSLIANDVTVQKWMPVTEGLPELIPCGAGTAYSEAVNVLTTGRKVLTAIWDGFDWICDAEFWDAEDEKITHWTPVLLPLPEPPKEEEI